MILTKKKYSCVKPNDYSSTIVESTVTREITDIGTKIMVETDSELHNRLVDNITGFNGATYGWVTWETNGAETSLVFTRY